MTHNEPEGGSQLSSDHETVGDQSRAGQSEQSVSAEGIETASQSEQQPPTQLSPQIYPDAGGNGNKFDKFGSPMDQLTLEMKVQDLINRVSISKAMLLMPF